MLTNTSDPFAKVPDGHRNAGHAVRTAQKVVIVNGGDEVAAFLDTVIEAGRYDVVFVESAAHAYSQVKKVTPHLIILCLDLNGDEGFRVLSMLKLDPDTRKIPLLTYALGTERTSDPPMQPSEDHVFPPARANQMN